MRRKKTMILALAAMMACGLTAACTVDDGDTGNTALQLYDNDAIRNAVYDGEWTTNKQVVDTARLEVTSVLKVRLPEMYLGISCFEEEHFSSLRPHTIEYKGLPAAIPFSGQGYTDYATFSELKSGVADYDGQRLFSVASFTVAVDGVSHRVDLLSAEPGNAVYRSDTGLWTIGLTVKAFNVTNMENGLQQVRTPQAPIALYYTAKTRIR